MRQPRAGVWGVGVGCNRPCGAVCGAPEVSAHHTHQKLRHRQVRPADGSSAAACSRGCAF
jgi:hypothetical protein